MSTAALLSTLRTRLLTFERFVGNSLATTLGTSTGAGSDGKLFIVQAPDNVTSASPSRWGVMSLKNRRTSAENAERELVDLEVLLFARPRSEQAAMEDAADACDEAMLRYVNRDTNLIGNWGRVRNTLPPLGEPADREVVQIRLVYTLCVWAGNLVQYHATA